MKLTKILFISLLVLPFLVQAQYLGGNGRGDISITLINVPLPVEGVTDYSPNKYGIEQNYPNPFNPVTVIKYSIPEISKVMLKLYNMLGEEVAALVNEEKVAGYYKVEFNAADLPSGVYFYNLRATPIGGQAGEFVQTKKMILLK